MQRHKVKRKNRHGTLCALSETLASSAFAFHNPIHPPINPIPKTGAKQLILLPLFLH
jgi:hypothetical protein